MADDTQEVIRYLMHFTQTLTPNAQLAWDRLSLVGWEGDRVGHYNL